MVEHRSLMNLVVIAILLAAVVFGIVSCIKGMQLDDLTKAFLGQSIIVRVLLRGAK